MRYENRCPQCVLENNNGICDRKDCSNYKKELTNTNTLSEMFWLENTTCKAKTTKPKRWSRKGVCPSCGVSQGSSHNKKCIFIYLPASKSS